MENPSNQDQNFLRFNEKKPLPNATAVLVLGILSIVVCQLLGIIGLIMANNDMKLYKENPAVYSEASLSNLQAGRICSIIGICLMGVALLVWLGILIFAFSFVPWWVD